MYLVVYKVLMRILIIDFNTNGVFFEINNFGENSTLVENEVDLKKVSN